MAWEENVIWVDLGEMGAGCPGGVVEGDVGDDVCCSICCLNTESMDGEGSMAVDVGAVRGDEEAEVAGS